MKFRSKNAWCSAVPLDFRSKSTSGFCIFSSFNSPDNSPGNTPVYLNVYDLTFMNSYLFWAGFGIFHTGVEVHGVEYAFGAHIDATSGVFEIEPKHCPGFKFRKSICMGTTSLDRLQVRDFMEHQAVNYNGNVYNLVLKNCNHFSEDICYKLTGNLIPKWVNRLAKIGSVCNFALPETMKATNVRRCRRRLRRPSDFRGSEDDKKRSRPPFVSCLSSISIPHKEISMSSLFLHSHYKGCLPPWQPRSRRRTL